ncbi:type III pantothenate kinase [candidate division KSB1 bacterium]|nr:type III pantothenate kinase [candidate division KSB1 bacterium]
MLLVMDIGNTNVVLGIYDGDELKAHWRLSASVSRTVDESWIMVRMFCQNSGIQAKEITGVALASVVPNLTPVFVEMVNAYLGVKVIEVTADVCPYLVIHYDNPHLVGADRLCNAVAGYVKFGGPLIIVDFGTATTFDVIEKKGDYLGGVIAPGVETSALDLHQRAARLPKVEFAYPPKVIGTSTEGSIKAGILYGAVDLVDGMVHRIWDELGGKTQVVATGGFAPLIAERSATIGSIEPFLVLEGLRIIYMRANR